MLLYFHSILIQYFEWPLLVLVRCVKPGLNMTVCSECEDPIEDDKTLCEGCEQRGKDSGEAQAYVRSELLTYVMTYVNNSSPKKLIEAINMFYKPEEIYDARCLLWRIYGDKLQNIKVPRKPAPGTKVSDATVMKWADELVNVGFIPLTKIPDLVMNFCAVDLSRVPKYAPEQDNLQSVLDRLALVEQIVKSQTQKIDANKSLIQEIRSDGGNATRRMTPYVPSSPPNRPLNDYRLPPPIRSPTRSTDQAHLFSGAIPKDRGVRNMAAEHRLRNMAADHPTSSGLIGMNDHGTATTGSFGSYTEALKSRLNNEEWITQKRERRQRIQERLKTNVRQVTGTKEHTTCKGVGDLKSIYVYEVDSMVSENDVKDMIISGDVPVKHIRQINGRNGGITKSFKVMIPAEKFESVMSADFWPSRMKCREWISYES